jgi:hypothetical protein
MSDSTERFDTLRRILEPVSSSRFISELWDAKPVLVHRDDAGYFSSLFSFEQLDHLIGFSFTNYQIKLIKDGEVTRPAFKRPGKTTINEMYRRFSDGTSIVVQDLHLRGPEVAPFINALSTEMSFLCKADAFASPMRAGGIDLMQSDQHLLILQISGRSHWDASDGLREQLEHVGRRGRNGDDEGIELGAGDTLYLPRGTARRFETRDAASLLLVIAIRANTWGDLLARAIEAESAKNIELRQALPFGAPLTLSNREAMASRFHELAQKALDVIDIGAARTSLSCEHKQGLHPLPDGHFTQLHRVDDIDLETTVARRPGSTGEIRFVHDTVELIFPGNFQQGPEKLFLAFDFMKEAAPFQVKDIPGWYSDNEKLLIVRHLLRKGYLKIAAD